MSMGWRFVAASLAAAISAAAGYPLFLFVLGVFSDPRDLAKSALLSGMVFVYALVVAAVHVVFLGIPAVLALRKLNALSLRTIVLAGLAGGAVPAAFLNLQMAPLGGLFGVFGALAFWAAWSRGGPDWTNLVRTKFVDNL